GQGGAGGRRHGRRGDAARRCGARRHSGFARPGPGARSLRAGDRPPPCKRGPARAPARARGPDPGAAAAGAVSRAPAHPRAAAALWRRPRGGALRGGDRRAVSAQRPSETVQAAPERAEPVRAGVVGLGYWGPNLARNLAAIPGCDLAWLCDPREGAAAGPSRAFPGARVTGDISDLLGDPTLDAVLLATPVPTHA